MTMSSSRSFTTTTTTLTPRPWHMTLGAQLAPDGVCFRVWAPKLRRMDVVKEDGGGSSPMEKDEGGYFFCVVPTAQAGMPSRYRLDNGTAYPDPCSRFQPQG